MEPGRAHRATLMCPAPPTSCREVVAQWPAALRSQLSAASPAPAAVCTTSGCCSAAFSQRITVWAPFGFVILPSPCSPTHQGLHIPTFKTCQCREAARVQPSSQGRAATSQGHAGAQSLLSPHNTAELPIPQSLEPGDPLQPTAQTQQPGATPFQGAAGSPCQDASLAQIKHAETRALTV